MLLTIISFLLILTVLVLIHELGHFLTAKFFGVKVEEFGFGFPPRLLGKKIGETLYSINWLPIGGFVKLFGEDEAGGGKISLPAKSNGQPNALSATPDRAYFTQSVWKRFVIVIAGVFMNFALATVLLTYLVMVNGVPTPGKNVYIVAVLKNTPAAESGLQKGDIIKKVDNIVISNPKSLTSYTKAHEGKKITLIIQTSGNKTKKVSLTPRVQFPSNEGAMGIAIGTNIVTKYYSWYQAPFVGLKEAVIQSGMIIQGLWQVFLQLVTRGSIPQGLAGPIGIAQVTGQFVQMGFDAVLSLLAILSLNLAILNILPIPALDGGRLFFILFEGITRKKVSPKIEGYMHMVGMVLLLTLIVFITFHDILRIATGGSILPK